MAKYILENAHVNWLAILALLTFFIVFSLVLLMVFGRGRGSYAEIAGQPLRDSYPLTEKNTPQ